MRLTGVIVDLRTPVDEAFWHMVRSGWQESLPDHAPYLHIWSPVDPVDRMAIAEAVVHMVHGQQWPDARHAEPLSIAVIVLADTGHPAPHQLGAIGDAMREAFGAHYRSGIRPFVGLLLQLPIAADAISIGDARDWLDALSNATDAFDRVGVMQPTNEHGDARGFTTLSEEYYRAQLAEAAVCLFSEAMLAWLNNTDLVPSEPAVFTLGVYTVSCPPEVLVQPAADAHLAVMVETYLQRTLTGGAGTVLKRFAHPEEVVAAGIHHPQYGTVFGAMRFSPDQWSGLVLAQLPERISAFHTFLVVKLIPAEIVRVTRQLAAYEAVALAEIHRYIDEMVCNPDRGGPTVALATIQHITTQLRADLQTVRASECLAVIRRALASATGGTMEIPEGGDTDYPRAESHLLRVMHHRRDVSALAWRGALFGMAGGAVLHVALIYAIQGGAWSRLGVVASLVAGLLVGVAYAGVIWYREWREIGRRIAHYQSTVVNHVRLQLADMMHPLIEAFYMHLLAAVDREVAGEEVGGTKADAGPSHAMCGTPDERILLGQLIDNVRTLGGGCREAPTAITHPFRQPVNATTTGVSLPYRTSQGLDLDVQASLRAFLRSSPLDGWRNAREGWLEQVQARIRDHAWQGYAYISAAPLRAWLDAMGAAHGDAPTDWMTIRHLCHPFIVAQPDCAVTVRWVLVPGDMDVQALRPLIPWAGGTLPMHDQPALMPCAGKRDVTFVQIIDAYPVRRLTALTHTGSPWPRTTDAVRGEDDQDSEQERVL